MTDLSVLKTLVNFDVAKELKVAGYNGKTNHAYRVEADGLIEHTVFHEVARNWNNSDETYSRPTQDEAARWLRRKFAYVIAVKCKCYPYEYGRYIVDIYHNWYNKKVPFAIFNDYESALMWGLLYCLEEINGTKDSEK